MGSDSLRSDAPNKNIDKHANVDRSDSQGLLPDLKEQVPPTYISRSEKVSTESDLIIPASRSAPDEKQNLGRTAAEISASCWIGVMEKPQDFKISGQTRHSVIESLSRELKSRYIDPSSAEKAAGILQQKEQADYSSIESAEKFVKTINEDLHKIIPDKHLGVFFDNKTLPADFAKTPQDVLDKQLSQQTCERSGVESVQTLEGNVGYLRLTGFFPSNDSADPRAAAETKKAIDSAMSQLSDKSALIIDLRDNTGGDPHTVLRTLNYLLDAGTHVNSIHWREGNINREERLVTSEPIGQKFGSQKPIYLLTSDQTFSAGEEFAYDLQSLGRAKVIGGVTGGGANPTYAFRLTDNFGVAMPTAQSINPRTHKNWEQTGVKPDIQVPQEQALEVARKLALSELAKK